MKFYINENLQIETECHSSVKSNQHFCIVSVDFVQSVYVAPVNFVHGEKIVLERNVNNFILQLDQNGAC